MSDIIPKHFTPDGSLSFVPLTAPRTKPMLVTENNRPALIGVITLFSGFLQTASSPGSGFVELARDCELRSIEILGRLGAYIRVQLLPHDADVGDVAESVWRYRPYVNGSKLRSTEQLHLVAGYSYGGQAAVSYCDELALRGGVRVVELALCDPVRRWKYLPGVAAATGCGRLHVPEVVEKCWWYKQENPRYRFDRKGGWFQPAGHDVVGTNVSDPVIRTSGHSYIDNDSEFRKSFLSSAKQMAKYVAEAIA